MALSFMDAAAQTSFQQPFIINIFDTNGDTHLCDEAHPICVFGEVLIEGKSASRSDILKSFQSCDHDIYQLYSKLSGQFSLIIYHDNELLLITDLFNTVPIFYTWDATNNNVLISNSLRQLAKNIAKPIRWNQQAIFNYFYFHCIPSPETIYQGIYKCNQGCLTRLNEQRKVVEQILYTPAYATHKDKYNEEPQHCFSLLKQAMAPALSKQTGAFLSGGLDSSTLAGLLSQAQKEAPTFSLGFHEKRYDETPFAEITARKFNTQHHTKLLDSDEAYECLVEMIQGFEQPFGNSSALATYFCAKHAAQNGIKTLIAGDGGDEIFAGNERYVKQKVFHLYQFVPNSIKPIFDIFFINKLAKSIPLLKKVASYIEQAKLPLVNRIESYNFINHFGSERIFHSDFLKQVDIEQPTNAQQQRLDQCPSDDLVEKLLYLDWKYTLADNDIVKVNEASQMSGILPWFPFLDKNVVNYSCDIPSSIKLPGFKLRHFFRKSCKGFLAQETLTKSKHGFGLPFGHWLKTNHKFQELALQQIEDFKRRNILKPEFIDDLLTEHKKGSEQYYGEFVWLILVLELWLIKS
ncbi:asparagine synthetase B [Thalassotalea maritima]|uniref:asparagine synthetase B family protein n=1 Tax=Thalassotalea maritima TaxID=3242416 RepID=UPI00352701AA